MKCFIVAALMTLTITNAAVIYQPGPYPLAGAPAVYYSDPVQFAGPRAVYRASNLGVSHQAELLGFNEPVYIDNLAPASFASGEAVVALPQPAPAVVVRQPSEVFAGLSHPAPELPVTTYEASNAGVTHRAELVGFSSPVVISNLESAPGAPEAEPAPEPAAAPAPEPAAAPAPEPAAAPEQAAPAPENLPVTTYEASNPGVTHRAELVGFSSPVVISNLESAPAAAAPEPAAPAAPAAPAPQAIYRAYNLGIAHEAPLPGHTKSVFAENLEAAPGSQPAPAVFVAAQPQFVAAQPQFASYRFVPY